MGLLIFVIAALVVISLLGAAAERAHREREQRERGYQDAFASRSPFL
ncbi:MAG: hypothetical protein AB7O92_33230 [Acidimicrobiia bacterium]